MFLPVAAVRGMIAIGVEPPEVTLGRNPALGGAMQILDRELARGRIRSDRVLAAEARVAELRRRRCSQASRPSSDR